MVNDFVKLQELINRHRLFFNFTSWCISIFTPVNYQHRYTLPVLFSLVVKNELL